MKHHIRLATQLDANQIAYVHIKSWQTTYRGLIPDDTLNNLSLTQREQEWQQYLQAGTTAWVIESENKIIGFASTCPTRDADDNPKIVAEISAIYLLPEYWRKGLGRELCQTVFDDVLNKKFKEIIIWVLEKNHQARLFYKTLGFFETGDVETDHIGCESLRVVRYRKVF